MKRVANIMFLIASMVIIMGCPVQVQKCPRYDCSIYDLDIELNKVKNCPSPSYPACSNGKSFAEWEVKEITIFDTDVSSAPFSPTEQNNYMQVANNMAQTQAPDCLGGGEKIVYKMTYNSGTYSVGGIVWEYLKAEVTYACCSGNLLDSK